MAGAVACPPSSTDVTIDGGVAAWADDDPHVATTEGAGMAYRYWCGECGFKTPWLSQAQGEQQQIEHYARRHPGIPPGGHVEANRRRPNGGHGCLPLMVIAVLLLILAAVRRRPPGPSA